MTDKEKSFSNLESSQKQLDTVGKNLWFCALGKPELSPLSSGCLRKIWGWWSIMRVWQVFDDIQNQLTGFLATKEEIIDKILRDMSINCFAAAKSWLFSNVFEKTLLNTSADSKNSTPFVSYFLAAYFLLLLMKNSVDVQWHLQRHPGKNDA